ncbi:hypothetical protein, unknown function [Leishmania tarentolae]|uniref:Uncharacterized protein n=1 Tax=Leishmania tarentolae TaxID=5689 RepID=A0A640KLA2_LEITA|nr:hypothetical protein, unknown function [Leishmania tarentolae]
MTRVPFLITAETETRSELGAAPAPPLKSPTRIITGRHSSFLPRLSITTASSLRPARVKSTTADAAAAAASTPTKGAAVVSVPQSAHAAITYPLLSGLLRTSLPAAPGEVTQSGEEVTLAGAVEALGGLAAVEALLSQLNDVAHSADVHNDDAFAVAIETCIQKTLGLRDVSIDTVEGHEPAVTGEEGGATGKQASPHVNVTIPLTISDYHSTNVTPLVAHQRPRRLGRSTAASAHRPNYSSALVLSVRRRRGVLTLRIVNVCFPGTRGTSSRTLRSGTVGSEEQKEKRRGRNKRQRQRRTAHREHQNPDSRRNRASSTGVSGITSCGPLSPNGTEGVVEGAGLGEVEPFSSGVTETPLWSSGLARLDSTNRGAGSASGMHNCRKPNGKARLSHSRRTTVASHRGSSKSNADTVLFNPCRPEDTTPFNAQRRPVTYSAAIVFQAPL